MRVPWPCPWLSCLLFKTSLWLFYNWGLGFHLHLVGPRKSLLGTSQAVQPHLPLISSFLFWVWEAGSHFAAHAGFELRLLLLQPLECRDGMLSYSGIECLVIAHGPKFTNVNAAEVSPPCITGLFPSFEAFATRGFVLTRPMFYHWATPSHPKVRVTKGKQCWKRCLHILNSSSAGC